MSLRSACALLLLCCGAAAAQARQSIPSFPSDVQLITVDAVVLDAEGRPVPGLVRDDFSISEDGRPQEIASFEAFALEAGAALEPSPVASNEPGLRPSGRAFGLLLDDLAMAPPLAELARSSALRFVERSLREGDEVVLATTSAELFWSTRIPEGREDLAAVLSRVKGHGSDAPGIDAITEYEAFRIANYEDAPAFSNAGPGPAVTRAGGRGSTGGSDALPTGGLGGTAARVKKRWEDARLCSGPSCDGLVRGRSQELDAQRRERMRATFRAARRQLGALSLMRGRKSLLLFSTGFLQDSGPDLRELAAASREANTAIYFLDVRGLPAQAGAGSLADPRRLPEQTDQAAMRFEETALAAAGSQALADDTGGFSVRHTNDLEAGARRIASESRVFYLLGFHPPEGKAPGQWRKLRVDVKRPGLSVRARRGYTLRAAAEAPASDEKADPSTTRALDSAHEATGIPLRAMVYVFEPRARDRTHVVVAAEFDADRVAFREKGAKRVAQLDVTVVALQRDGGHSVSHDERLELALQGDEVPGWRALVREFELPPGVSQARVVIRDPASGALGSVWQRFEVPAASTLRFSTPILTDQLEPASAPGARGQPAIAVHRRFRPEGLLYCEYQVFGAERAGGGAPRVSAGLELTLEGHVVRSADPTPIAPDRDGRLVRLVGLALDGMQEGDYELRLTAQDQASGARLERVEPFTLARER
jgi:VWFA-related protein